MQRKVKPEFVSLTGKTIDKNKDSQDGSVVYVDSIAIIELCKMIPLRSQPGVVAVTQHFAATAAGDDLRH